VNVPSIITKDSATIGRILQENGYRTSWFGKDHNVPVYEASKAGPFEAWPSGMGFDYFYGFIGGDTSQWMKQIPSFFGGTRNGMVMSWPARIKDVGGIRPRSTT
jgi:arylsulfatase A-like enzyme